MDPHKTASGCVGALIVAGLIAAVGISIGSATWDERVQTCTITDKDRGAGDGTYRIYTDECGVLANTDSLWHGKFNSADMQAALEPGETYELRLVGWRVEMWSMFPNIIAIEGVG